MTQLTEETTNIEDVGEFTYSLSNKLAEIGGAVYAKTGMKVELDDRQWEANDMLDPSVKDMMNRQGVEYSMTRYFDDGRSCVTVNKKAGDKWFIVVFKEINNSLYVTHGKTAVESLSEAVRLNPESAFAYYSRSVAYRQQGQYEKAIEDLCEAIKLEPANARFHRNRGFLYNKEKEPGLAIADFTEVIKLDPTSAKAYLDRGFAYQRKGTIDKFIAAYKEANGLEVVYELPCGGRGDDYAKKDANDLAIGDFTDAIRLDPKHVVAHAERGDAYMEKGEHTLAIADFIAAIKLDPELDERIKERTITFENIISLDDRSTQRIIRELDSEELSLALIGANIDVQEKFLINMSRRAGTMLKEEMESLETDGKASTEAVLEARKKIVAIWLHLESTGMIWRFDPAAAAAYHRGNELKDKYDLAIAEYTEAIRLAPGFTSAYSCRSRAYEGKGEYDLAIADCTELIKHKRDSWFCSDYIARGDLYKTKGEYELAIADYTDAIRLDTEGVWGSKTYLSRGSAYRQLGDREKAIQDLEKALEIDPDNDFAKNELAEINAG